jgi:hypothetical protein
MVRISENIIFAFLGLTAGVFSTPATGSTSPSDGDISIQDIIDAPYNPPPLANPGFVPILAVGNDTLVKANPAAQSKVNNVPSVLSSISTAAAATATSVVPTPAPTLTARSKVRRGLPTPAPIPIYVILIIISVKFCSDYAITGRYGLCKLYSSICTKPRRCTTGRRGSLIRDSNSELMERGC